jgi:diguanylate cyclase (GGDEF)-like protein
MTVDSASIQSVLKNLIALTNERDVFELEFLLAQSLFDLIAPFNIGGAKSIVIYRADDLNKQLFSAVVIGKKSKTYNLSSQLRQSLSDCFKSGEYCIYEQQGEPHATLYPIKNTIGRTVAIIAIEAQISDPQLHETITLLLQIHQNFAGLISDNEHDTLTGLLNRKTFERKIDKILANMHKRNARKNDQSGHLHFLVMFDIDHFKKVNDEYGHLIGDEVLLEVSQIMTQTFRDKDQLFRYGGEEFVGLLECANAIDIENILNRFRKKVESFAFPKVGTVTVSAGYSKISVYDTSNQLVGRADTALYFAKNNGRNRICHYEQLIADGDLTESKEVAVENCQEVTLINQKD